MILDLDGTPAPRPMSSRWGQLLTIASVVVATASLLVIAARADDPAVRAITENAPSVLEQAFSRAPAPRLALAFPAEVAVPLAPTGSQYGSGIGRNALASRSFRLRGSSDVVNVARVPDVLPIVAPAARPPDALYVRGTYAQFWIVEPTSVSVVRWTENGTTYEMSSRTLRPRDLARLADQLR